MANVPATCGKCHEGIAHQFGRRRPRRDAGEGSADGAPACQTCHTAHAIQHADNPEWQLTVVSQCGTCHQDKLKTYRDTFHGQVDEPRIPRRRGMRRLPWQSPHSAGQRSGVADRPGRTS